MNNKIVFVGNPNTGKTTFFNTLSKSDEHVGNWHGVTVDAKEKKFYYNKKELTIVDLPGLYSLTNYSYEEEVSKKYIYENDDLILNICDANNLSRNLFLTLQLIEMGKKIVVCVNMKKEFLKQGNSMDVEKLSTILGVPVFLIDATNKKEVRQVVDFALNYNDVSIKSLPYLKDDCVLKMKTILTNCNFKFECNKEYLALKMLEKDEFVENNFNFDNIAKQKVDNLQNNFNIETISQLRYEYIDKISEQTIKHNQVYGKNKLDGVLLNKYFALPCFLCILALVFFLTFSSIGQFLANVLESFTNIIFAKPLLLITQKLTTNGFIISFVQDAIIGGTLTVVNFLPQVVLLFLFLNILEDTGYMSRLAFVLDDYFSKIGLSGKCIFSLLMGFGCATTAAITSRNMEDENGKIKTAILTPYLSCTAKLPLYSTICTAFFASSKILVIFLMYLLGVLVSVLVSYIFEKTILKSKTQSFILEFPPYRLPNFKRVLKNILKNAQQFIVRVGSVMFCFSIVIWFMQNLNFKFQLSQDDSMLKTIGVIIAPIFKPLGFGSWGVACTLVCGVIAKEMIVSTMGKINNVDGSTRLVETLLISSSVICFSQTSAISYLVFSSLYLPCISTITVLSKEIGTKWTLFACGVQFAVAYLVSFAVYKIAGYANLFGITATLVSLLIFILIIVCVLIIVKIAKKKKSVKCLSVFCKGCKNNGKCSEK